MLQGRITDDDYLSSPAIISMVTSPMAYGRRPADFSIVRRLITKSYYKASHHGDMRAKLRRNHFSRSFIIGIHHSMVDASRRESDFMPCRLSARAISVVYSALYFYCDSVLFFIRPAIIAAHSSALAYQPQFDIYSFVINLATYVVKYEILDDS